MKQWERLGPRFEPKSESPSAAFAIDKPVIGRLFSGRLDGAFKDDRKSESP
jgi:hypothetical protein